MLILNMLINNDKTFTIFRKTSPKLTDYQWFLAIRIVIHLPTDCGWKVWYLSRTAGAVSVKTVSMETAG